MLHQHNDLSQFPPISFQSAEQWRKKSKVLLQYQQQSTPCHLLGLQIGPFSDPHSLKDLHQCLDRQNIRGSGGVTVVQGKDRDMCFSNGCQFVVEAKTDRHWQIFFQKPVYHPVKPLWMPLLLWRSPLSQQHNAKKPRQKRIKDKAGNGSFVGLQLQPK